MKKFRSDFSWQIPAELLKSRQFLPIINRMDAEKIILALLLSAFPAAVLSSSEFYLCRVGPPPLRFAPPPSLKEFKWPVPLKPAAPETNSIVTSDSAPVSNTNFEISVAQSPEPVLAPAMPAQMPETNVALWPQIPLGTDGNLLSASNLLILTPQMLADYFKANLDSLNRSSNVFPGADIPFNPPTPKPPSSEATYTTQ